MELLTGSFDSKPGQTVKLIAHIKDNGVDIDGGQLVFKLNGVSLKDENGSAVIETSRMDWQFSNTRYQTHLVHVRIT